MTIISWYRRLGMRACVGTGEREREYNVPDTRAGEGVEPILRIMAYYASGWPR